MNAIIQQRSARKRHKLVRKDISYSECGTIPTLEGLRHHLQTAIEIEHATLPPYLTALYSIKEGSNAFAYQAIQSVAMEEMLHMILACNILNAIGGHPAINKEHFVPAYPGYLPHSDDALLVGLAKMTPETIETFLNIEQPAASGAPPQPNHWHTIGQFYEAIDYALSHFEHVTEGGIFTGDESYQLDENDYYSGGGKLFKVRNLADAKLAIEEIISQGEGMNDGIFDSDHRLFGEEVDIAHYFKFNEIYIGRRYTLTDTPEAPPSGARVDIQWDEVYNMHPNPSIKNYPQGSPLWQQTNDFNKTYMAMLDSIHCAVNGKPEALKRAVPLMFDIKYKAIALMKTPYKDGKTAGPSFEYVR
ncbi:MAG: hypothetical protein ACI8R9_000633 [Paraglaciecola sp.]|jgi:hypothetical protein